jgi:hypothetical protein
MIIGNPCLRRHPNGRINSNTADGRHGVENNIVSGAGEKEAKHRVGGATADDTAAGLQFLRH